MLYFEMGDGGERKYILDSLLTSGYYLGYFPSFT